MSSFPERDGRWIFRGRLALALAGRRASRCTNPRCARERHCLAKIRSSRSATGPDCPVMTDAEWGALRTGFGGIRNVMQPFYFAQDAKELAARKSLPKAERDRLSEADTLGNQLLREHMQKHPYEPPWWEMLWLEPSEDGQLAAGKVATAERALVEYAVRIGCRCASEGMVEDCERCKGACRMGTAPAARA
jgi:hypothetical protein